MLQATRRGSWFDRVSSGVLIFFYSLPDFWGALMMLLVFAYWWPILPAGRHGRPDDARLHGADGPAFVDRVRHLVLPVGVAHAAHHGGDRALPTRGDARGAARRLHPHGARERRCRNAQIVWRHACAMRSRRWSTLLGLLLPALLGGALFVEKVFSWPGMGMLAANAIGGTRLRSRDGDGRSSAR